MSAVLRCRVAIFSEKCILTSFIKDEPIVVAVSAAEGMGRDLNNVYHRLHMHRKSLLNLSHQSEV